MILAEIEEDAKEHEENVEQASRTEGMVQMKEEICNLRRELELCNQNLEALQKDIGIRFRAVVGMFDKLEVEIEQLKQSKKEDKALKNEEQVEEHKEEQKEQK